MVRQRITKEQKIHFLKNIIIGVLIVTALQFLEQTDFGENTLNKAFDHVIRKEAEAGAQNERDRDAKIAKNIIFVDLAGSWQQRGRPLLTPRETLADVVNVASQGGAKVIVLDVLLEDRDCCTPQDDMKMRSVLEGIASGNQGTKILFPVRMNSKGGVRETIVDDLVKKTPQFSNALPLISSPRGDRIIRYWVPHERTANGNVLWNMALLASMLYYGKEDVLKELEKRLTDQSLKEPFRISLGAEKHIWVSPSKDDIFINRIRFFLIPRDTISSQPAGNIFELVYDAGEVSHVDFKDKILIIGNSDSEAGDSHKTPIGAMSGIFVMGNVLNTILLGLQPSHPPFVVNVILEFCMVMLSAYVFSRIASFFSKLLKAVVLIGILSFISYVYFTKTGNLLCFSVAAAGMGFYDTISGIEKMIMKKIKREGK